jgi:hypothetical protein
MAVLFCTPVDSIEAQHWSDGMLPGAEWEQAIGHFELTWADSVPEKGKGFKPFHRWRHFAEARFAFEGSTPLKPGVIWSATQWERMARQSRLTEPAPLWQRATPEGVPLVGGAGRINRVVIDPLDTSRWFACAPSGGLWISSSSGTSWTLMNTHDWAGMGVSDLALHPQDPDCFLVATGDSDFGSAYGVGIMRTTDGGASWETTGLSQSIPDGMTCSRVHRKEGAPHHILAATSDGIWMSEDDGVTFTQQSEGIFSDLLPHPGDSAIWHAAKRPGELLRSTDGGRTWSALDGLPSPFTVSRYTLATSPTQPSRVAAIAAKSGTQGLQAVYLSTDSGATFTALSNLPNILGWTVDGVDFGGQGFYDLSLAIDPEDADHIIAGGVNLWETWDGGTQWQCIGHWFGGGDAAPVHADHHAVTFIPGSSHWVSAHDGGVSRRISGGYIDLSHGLDVGQIYKLGWSSSRPDRLISGWQDNGINLLKEGIHAQVAGADGFHCLFAPQYPDTMLAAEYYGKVLRSQDDGWSWFPWVASNGAGVHEQGDWNTPMAFSPTQPHRYFIAKHRLYWTDDDGAIWNQTNALPGPEIEVLALSPSHDSTAAVAKGTTAFLTVDLQHWQPLTGLPGLPVLGLLFEKGHTDHLWASFGGYDPAARVWKTEDGGGTWNAAGSGLPALPVNALAHDTVAGDLFAGTDAGVYVLPFGSEDWIPYKSGLPEVICSDLGIRHPTGELLLATYGRGIWKAPLYSTPEHDAAIVGLEFHHASPCSGPIDVAAQFRNAGSDTLVAATLVWHGVDTVDYGFILPPGLETPLDWDQAHRGSVDPGGTLTVRILSITGLSGGLAGGQLTLGTDAVPENDMLGRSWPYRQASGAVVMSTLADCTPRESAWDVLDTSGSSWGARQHFPIESAKLDTLCLSHGCYDVQLHDGSANGFAGPMCGMEGALVLLSTAGDTLWSVTDSAGIDFASGPGGGFCLPVNGAEGCTSILACNFDPAAGIDNGSCLFGCVGSTCPGDMDGDGLYGASDILAVLAEFGCILDCLRDLTGDGTVSANDVLALLALYGESCAE